MNTAPILTILLAALPLGAAGRHLLPDARRRRAHQRRIRTARTAGRIPQQRRPQ